MGVWYNNNREDYHVLATRRNMVESKQKEYTIMDGMVSLLC